MKRKTIMILFTVFSLVSVCAQNPQKYAYYHGNEKKEIQINYDRLLVYFNRNLVGYEMIDSIFNIRGEVRLGPGKGDTLSAFVIDCSEENYETTLASIKELSYVYDVEPTVGEGGNVLVSNQVYVQLNAMSDTVLLKQMANQMMIRYEGSIVEDSVHELYWYSLSTNKASGNALEIASLYIESGLFGAVDPGLIFPIRKKYTNISKSIPEDLYLSDQWSIADLYDIWDGGILGDGVSIALIDDGVEINNSEFSTLSSFSYDFYNGTYSEQPQIWGSHGTNMAGVIFSDHDNENIAGIAPDAVLINISAFNTEYPPIYYEGIYDEQAFTALFNALATAFTLNADIVLCPLDYVVNGNDYYPHPLIMSMVNSMFAYGRNLKGTVIISSSGYDYGTLGIISHPLNIDDRVIIVGASSEEHERVYSSNYGDQLDLVAPGESILTTDVNYSSYYASYLSIQDGPGVASAHVAGVVALMLSANPNLTRSQIDWILKHTAYKTPEYTFGVFNTHPDGTWNNELGYGEIQSARAINWAQYTYSNIPSLTVKDTVIDNGMEPSVIRGILNSPSIVIRDASNVNIMSTIGPGDTRMISVTVHNHSTTDVVVDPADVKLYYRNYTSGTLTWNTSLFSSPISPAGTSPVTISANGGSHTFVIPLTMPDVYPVTFGQIWRGMLVAVIDDNTSNINGFTDINMPIDDFVAMNRLVAAKGYTHYQDPTPGDPILPPKPKLAVNPNPTLGRTVVELNGLATETVATLMLTDGFGNLITTEQMNTDRSSIDLTGKPSGIYYVYVVVGEEVADVKKVILQ